MNRIKSVFAALVAALIVAPSAFAQSPTPAKIGKDGVQKATIVINGGYFPATLAVKAGTPVELTFVRKSAAGCDGELLIPGLKINKVLEQGEKTVVKFTPKKAQTISYSCGMKMYKGQVVVK